MIFPPCARSPRPARRCRRRISASSMTASSRTCIWPRFPAAPTSSPASCSACRPSRSGPARSRARALAWPSTSGTMTASRSGRKRANWSAPRRFPVHADRLLERSRRQKYHAAYFERFDNVWCHGDFAEWTVHGGLIIHGRSDATLNPGGVRIGTAEIYNQVEQMPEIARGDLHRPGFRQRRARRAVRAAGRRRRSRRRSGKAHPHAKSAPAPARATCRPGSSPSPTSRAPSPARSPSSPCATSCMAAPIKNKEALANPEALELFRDPAATCRLSPRAAIMVNAMVVARIYLDFTSGTHS